MTKRQRIDIILSELERLFPDVRTALAYRTPWELIVAVALSAQTTDKKVNEVTPRLFAAYPKPEDLAEADIADVMEKIAGVNFYKGKAQRIVDAAQMFVQVFGGEVPQTIAELSKLPGVGRKTANVVLAEIYGITEGIAVDTHVARLSKKFGLTKHTDPKKIEQDLLNGLPKEAWRYITLRMIEYGREYSTARQVDLDTDPISVALKEET